MRALSRIFVPFTSVCLSLSAWGQNGQSLGEVARQTRQQNQQNGEQNAQSAKNRVFSDEDKPDQVTNSSAKPTTTKPTTGRPTNNTGYQYGKMSAEQWRAMILSVKNAINATQIQIDRVNAAIRFASPTCTNNCVQKNERAIEKELGVERLRAQLEDQKRRLGDLQEAARKQGYGNAVYDP